MRRATTALRRALPLLRRPGAVVALLFLAAVFAAAVHPALFTATDPAATDPSRLLRPPGLGAVFGTDQLGRDLFSRVVHGASLTVRSALGAIVLAAVCGLVIGVIAGAAGGVVDTLLMRIVDVKLAIPGLLLALVIVSAAGFSAVNAAVAVGIGLVPGFARTTRSRVLTIRALPFIEAATVAGLPRGAIMLRHILPHATGPVAVLSVLDFGGAILAIASLSFLGFGAQPPLADWGALISDGRGFLVTAPWVSLIPGLVVALTVFSLNHIAKSIEEVRS